MPACLLSVAATYFLAHAARTSHSAVGACIWELSLTMPCVLYCAGQGGEH